MKRHIDAKLLLFVIFLITFGLVMVLSSSAIGEVSGTQFKYFYRQLIAVFLGGILCAGAALTPTDTLRKNHLLFYVVVAFGLSLCFRRLGKVAKIMPPRYNRRKKLSPFHSPQ